MPAKCRISGIYAPKAALVLQSLPNVNIVGCDKTEDGFVFLLEGPQLFDREVQLMVRRYVNGRVQYFLSVPRNPGTVDVVVGTTNSDIQYTEQEYWE